MEKNKQKYNDHTLLVDIKNKDEYYTLTQNLSEDYIVVYDITDKKLHYINKETGEEVNEG